MLASINRFNIETRRQLALAERQFIDEQEAEAEKQLRHSEDRLQAFLIANRVSLGPQLVFERGRLERDVSLRMQVYSMLVQVREQARLKELRQTPVITTIESPRLAVLPEKRGAVLRALIGGVVGALFGMLVAMLASTASDSVQAKSSQASELRALLRDALPRIIRGWIGV
jgi:uncharacterized protein involved in exopolysaccharide biosynthesis